MMYVDCILIPFCCVQAQGLYVTLDVLKKMNEHYTEVMNLRI